MPHPFALLVGAGLVLGSATVALASDTGRYTMTPSDGGFVRLDTVTGTVSVCANVAGTFTCKAAPDDAIALQAEIDRLAEQNRKLQGDIDALRLGQREVPPPAGSGALGLPTDEEVDKAMSFVEKLMRRFKTLMEELKEDPSRTTPL
jgi:hypothetical protein